MQLDGIKVAHFLAALHEVCEGDIIHDLVDGVIELLPHRQGNTGLRLWTVLHAFFHTGDRRQRAFCQAQNIANRVFLRISVQRHIVPDDLSGFLLFKFHFQVMFQPFSIFFAPSGDAVQLPATLSSVSAAGNNDSVFYLLQPFIRLFVRPDTVITGTFKLRRKDCSVIHNLITVQDHGIFYMIPRYIQ